MTTLDIICLVLSYLCAFGCGMQLMERKYGGAIYSAVACILNIIAAFC